MELVKPTPSDIVFYTMFGDPVRNEKGWEVKEIKMLGKVGSSRRVYLSECVDEIDSINWSKVCICSFLLFT